MNDITKKKKILWCGETGFVSSGYGVATKELMRRFYDSGKYELAEHASYIAPNDPRIKTIPWKIYGNMPVTPEEHEAYNGNPQNQFGFWRFDEVVLNFRPDIVIGIRDHWMDSHILHSPLKKYYSTLMMPTVDSAPQSTEWIADYCDVDTVLTYTEFSKRVLEEESGYKIKVLDTPGLGVNTEVFSPVQNKYEHNKQYGLENKIIIGTVMRNQKRKLFSDLFDAFRDFCLKYPQKSANVYLYCHTSYPDLGWDLPRLIRDSGISHKILFTYYCSTCGNFFVSNFQDAKTVCEHCNRPTASLPNVIKGVSDKQLNHIYNLFDLYIQYAMNEGLGVPLLEASACAVPFMAVNYSAMESVTRTLDGYPINIGRAFRETESYAIRVYPDNNDFIEKLYKFITLPEVLRVKKGRRCYELFLKHYTWDVVASKWMNAIDSTNIYDNWDSPPQFHQPNTNIPPGLSNIDFVRWCIVNILGDISKLNSYLESKLLRNLNYGASIDGHGGFHFSDLSNPNFQPRFTEFDHKKLVNILLDYRQRMNYTEHRRVNYNQQELPMFIQEALH